jgi:predicted Zn-dependent peptidase
LSGFELLDGKPQLINTVLARYAAVTPERVQAVAKKYLTAERRTILAIQPDPGAKASAPAVKGGF